MSSDLQLLTSSPAGCPQTLDGIDLLAAFLAGRNPRTLRAYSRDLEDFARWIGQPHARAALGLLLSLGAGQANAAALGYRAHLAERGLASATIGRRLAAVRSVVKLGRTLGLVSWTLDIAAPRVEKPRDTAGPGAAGWQALWHAAADAGDGPKARRDRAMLRLLYDRALHSGEAVGLDLADIELNSQPPSVAVLGKGRMARERLTINGPTARALAQWVEARGTEPGPLFVRLDPGSRGERLTGEAVRRILGELARRAGLARPVRPHGLRHAAITAALDAGRDVRDVAQFSRHRDIRTLLIYDDRRQDVGGAITRLLGQE